MRRIIYAFKKKLGNKSHPNPWIFVELIQSEEVFMPVRYEQTDNGSFKSRRRPNIEIKKDLDISTAKISFLESDKSIQSIDKLLCSLRDLVPKFIKK